MRVAMTIDADRASVEEGFGLPPVDLDPQQCQNTLTFSSDKWLWGAKFRNTQNEFHSLILTVWKSLSKSKKNHRLRHFGLMCTIRSLFTRTNILARRFAKCSSVVKIALFKAYCICLYDAGLWWRFKSGSFNRLSSCYNKCMKLFFGYKRGDSVTQILFDLVLPSFDTIVHNSKAVLSLS